MNQTPRTKAKAYRTIKQRGEDVILRRRVAAALGIEPRTTHELTQAFEKSANALRPRVNELIRMGCVERDGTRVNPSGHEAYVNSLTRRGERYALGEVDPDPGPTIAERKRRVVAAARDIVRGDVPKEQLARRVLEHDDAKRAMDPEWSP